MWEIVERPPRSPHPLTGECRFALRNQDCDHRFGPGSDREFVALRCSVGVMNAPPPNLYLTRHTLSLSLSPLRCKCACVWVCVYIYLTHLGQWQRVQRRKVTTTKTHKKRKPKFWQRHARLIPPPYIFIFIPTCLESFYVAPIIYSRFAVNCSDEKEKKKSNKLYSHFIVSRRRDSPERVAERTRSSPTKELVLHFPLIVHR